MIFVTVGVQLPFDRLTRAVDRWAADRGRDDVVAQIGEAGWKPAHIRFHETLSASAFADYVSRAEFVVAHAGIGSILTALELAKPILVMARRADLGEHRNDHQLATARSLSAQFGIEVAEDEDDLRARLDRMSEAAASPRVDKGPDDTLLETIRAFVDRGRP